MHRRAVWNFLHAAAALSALAACQNAPPRATAPQPHNVVLFVADGMRYGAADFPEAAAFAAVRKEGVDFANSHSLYPTVTTANASAIATGHYLGDTGDFGNTIYAGAPALPHAYYARVAGLEDDPVLRDMNERFGGNYLGEDSLLALASAHGYAVAAIGKTGPAAIQNLAGLEGGAAIVIDETTGLVINDKTGEAPGPRLDPEIAAAIKAAGLPAAPPARTRPDRAQTEWFAKVAADVLIPRFKQQGKPFVLVFWSPDPDATQHAQEDSLNALEPGVNGPTSHAAVGVAAGALQRIRDALAANGLDKTTDVVVTADHGFSTVSTESKTSYAASLKFRDYPNGRLVPGFLSIDLAYALKYRLFAANGLDVLVKQGLAPRTGGTLIGPDFEHPRVIVGANGGTDLIYLPESDAPQLAQRVVAFLTQQDYTAAIFADDAFGDIPGALPMSSVELAGSARTPKPAIVVSFRSYGAGCAEAEMCAVEIADTNWRAGQGIHGGLHRGDTRNFIAAVGPDFKAAYVDRAPVSNADLPVTIAHVLGFAPSRRGVLAGRVVSEALPGGGETAAAAETKRSMPAANGFVTILNLQKAGGVEYYDAAGAPGRAVGLQP
ncbi:MAG: alkaline phosphatase family protein [Hyphomonadaceae bacterium]